MSNGAAQPPSEAQCPFCGNFGGTALWCVSAIEAGTHFLRPHHDQELFSSLVGHIEKLWHSDTCSLVECPSCGGVFSWPFVGGDSNFYESAYKHAYGYPQDRWEFDKSLAAMQEEGFDSNLRCLEMGAGNGAFLKRLLALGFFGSRLCAVEYSERARKTIRDVDLAIQTFEDIDDVPASLAREPFGYAFAFQVLEHLHRPVEFLTKLRNRLAENGRAFISVPNPARIRFNETNSLLLDMPPNHVSRIGVGAMEALAKRAGFRLERSVVQPFVAFAGVKQFVNYRFKRMAQRTGTIENSMERRGPATLAKAIGATLALPDALTTLPARRDGESLLFILRKSS